MLPCASSDPQSPQSLYPPSPLTQCHPWGLSHLTPSLVLFLQLSQCPPRPWVCSPQPLLLSDPNLAYESVHQIQVHPRTPQT